MPGNIKEAINVNGKSKKSWEISRKVGKLSIKRLQQRNTLGVYDKKRVNSFWARNEHSEIETTSLIAAFVYFFTVMEINGN